MKTTIKKLEKELEKSRKEYEKSSKVLGLLRFVPYKEITEKQHKDFEKNISIQSISDKKVSSLIRIIEDLKKLYENDF